MTLFRSVRPRLAVFLAAGLSALVVNAAHAQASAPAGGMGHDMSSMPSGGSAELHGAMMRGMQAMQQMRPTGDVDRDFAAMMKMHHQQAVDMAQVQLKQGKSPELKKLAAKMVRDQQKEIAQLDRWLQSHP